MCGGNGKNEMTSSLVIILLPLFVRYCILLGINLDEIANELREVLWEII